MNQTHTCTKCGCIIDCSIVKPDIVETVEIKEVKPVEIKQEETKEVKPEEKKLKKPKTKVTTDIFLKAEAGPIRKKILRKNFANKLKVSEVSPPKFNVTSKGKKVSNVKVLVKN